MEGWRGGEVAFAHSTLSPEMGGRERERGRETYETHGDASHSLSLSGREVFPAAVGDGLVSGITVCVCSDLIHKKARRRRRRRCSCVLLFFTHPPAF